MVLNSTSFFNEEQSNEHNSLNEEVLIMSSGFDLLPRGSEEYVGFGGTDKINFDTVCGKFTKSVESELDKFPEMRAVREVFIHEFIGEFDELLFLLDTFQNLQKVVVDKMVSTDMLKIEYEHKSDYEIEIDKCSVFNIEIRDGLSIPRIVLNNSMLCDTFSKYKEIVVLGTFEDWFDDETNFTNTEFNRKVRLLCENRFNEVYIFNEIFETRLKRLNYCNFRINFNPVLRKDSIGDIIGCTEYGYYLRNKQPFTIYGVLECEDFKSKALTINHEVISRFKEER